MTKFEDATLLQQEKITEPQIVAIYTKKRR
jgi:hypothetical protein